jgi:hypothetical protein
MTRGSCPLVFGLTPWPPLRHAERGNDYSGFVPHWFVLTPDPLSACLSSPPDPLSAMRRGGTKVEVVPPHRPHSFYDALSCQLSIPDPDHMVARGHEHLRSCGVIATPGRLSVMVPVELQYKAQFRTIEIHDEPVDHMLATKLQAEDRAIPKQRPGMPLDRCGVTTQLAREREFPAGRDGAQRVHALP